jgi:endonuclease YncB( thermonuclease family)|tara:strand:- start:1601 stop:2080 length:480 start_codon:yes stop_codon:yes gene_type:complete
MFLSKKNSIFLTSILSLVFLLTFNQVKSQEIKVVDGDTIYLNGEKIRFTGIDTPELKQTCIKDGTKNTCGITAKQKLINKIGNNIIECISEGKDQYKRTLAECFVNNESLSSYLVRSGYAFAYRRYSKKFIIDEDYAKANQLGMWSMKFIYPWDYRKNH